MSVVKKDKIPSILVVDDDPLISGMLTKLLSTQGYQVNTAENGLEALKKLEDESSLNKRCSLIISDIMMPKLDGYGLYTRVRENPHISTIPFIFLTALSDKQNTLEGIELGVDDYISKPFDSDRFLSLVKGKIKRFEEIDRIHEQESNHYRKQVIQTLSHEFRTPLVSINTGVELLQRETKKIEEGKSAFKPEKTARLLKAIQNGGERLEKLVSDFIYLQQIEAGKTEENIKAHSKLIRVDEIVEQLKREIGDRVLEQGFLLNTTVECKEARCSVYLEYIVESLKRLVENGIKFSTDKKEIDLQVVREDDRVVFSIYDYGIGIDPGFVEQSVQSFAQCNREQMEQQGSGLGLAIVESFVTFHGGKFFLFSQKNTRDGKRSESSDSVGSCAQIVLPLAKD